MTEPSEGAAAGSITPEFTSSCTAGETKFRVTQNNIYIRSTPGGSIKAPISEGATFVSRRYPNGDLGWTCTSSEVEGTVWIYGMDESSFVIGWVGFNWLGAT